MRVYRIDYRDQQSGNNIVWVGSKKEAAAKRKEIRDSYKNDRENLASMNTTLVEIPDGRKGLLEWLNRNVRFDNDI